LLLYPSPIGLICPNRPIPRTCPFGRLTADRRLYLRSEDGPISLVTSSRQDFVLQGRFSQPFRSNRKAWTHLAIANGMMYVRDQNVLLCYDICDREETGEKEGAERSDGSDGSG